MAFDRASVRTIDRDGRLHVLTANISKSNICGYLGSEIPDAEALGLESGRVYQLLRDPAELARGAPSFNQVPILMHHVPVTAADHRPDLVVGATGSNAKFSEPFLTNSLVIWSAEAIAMIESGEQRELSSAYRYRADMTPGSYEGQRYDGRMVDLCGNHVAVVAEGRVGSDCIIGDSANQISISARAAEADFARRFPNATRLRHL